MSTTFEGRVVVSGGNLRFDEDDFNTVEAFNHAAKRLFKIPNLNYGRNFHSLVA